MSRIRIDALHVDVNDVLPPNGAQFPMLRSQAKRMMCQFGLNLHLRTEILRNQIKTLKNTENNENSKKSKKEQNLRKNTE